MKYVFRHWKIGKSDSDPCPGLLPKESLARNIEQGKQANLRGPLSSGDRAGNSGKPRRQEDTETRTAGRRGFTKSKFWASAGAPSRGASAGD